MRILTTKGVKQEAYTLKTTIWIAFVLNTFFSCQQNNGQEGKVDNGSKSGSENVQFADYIKQIKQIDFPLKTTCEKELDEVPLLFSDSIIAKFGPENSQIYGKLANKEKFSAVIYLFPADILLPIIQTTDKQGNKISTLNLYENCNEDEFYRSTSWATINKDLTIVISDSIITYKRDKEGEIIQNSQKVRINHKNFYIDNTGQIRKTF